MDANTQDTPHVGEEGSTAADDETHMKLEYLISEHTVLREEIIKRIEIRYQVIGLTLLFAGTFLGVGFQKGVPGSFLLVYPFLAMFLAGAWARIGSETLNIAKYIRVHTEQRLGSPGWETYRLQQHLGRRGALARILSSRGIFLGTQLAAIIIGILRESAPLVALARKVMAAQLSSVPALMISSGEYLLVEVLLCLDILALIVTALVPERPVGTEL